MKIDYRFKPGSNWVQIWHLFDTDDVTDKVFEFYIKTLNDLPDELQFKLVDKDESNFGVRMELPVREDGWKFISVPFSKTNYWWGGDKNFNEFSGIYFAIGQKRNERGTLLIDEISFRKEVQMSDDERRKKMFPDGNLDNFNIIDGWSTYQDFGSMVELSPAIDNGRSALSMQYDLSRGQWIDISKEFPLGHINDFIISFDYRGDGKGKKSYIQEGDDIFLYEQRKNNMIDLDLKLIDRDNSSFGIKIKDANSTRAWEHIRLPVSNASYYWGGDSKLDSVVKIDFSISGSKGAKGEMLIDNLRIYRKQSIYKEKDK